MKTLSSISPSRYGCSIGVVNALLAVVLTVLSFQYVQPKDCYRFCNSEPCPPGGCRFGEQKAGWPLPVFVDNPGGGSPTGGWGLIGPEDPALFMPLLLDILFYSLIVWLIMWVILLIWRRKLPVKDLLTSLVLNFFLAACLWFYSWSFGVPIGRGHMEQVDINTQTGISANMAFSPIVRVPLEELIGNYGNPDDVWILSEATLEKLTTRMVLHWGSIGMFVELPQVANNTYTVRKTTAVEMIIFPNEEPVIGVDGKSLGAKKMQWTGYGDYQP